MTEADYEKKCNVKKHVIGKLDDNGQSYQQSSGVNTYMMRLAEVYLNYTEAAMGNSASTSRHRIFQLHPRTRWNATAWAPSPTLI